MKEIKMPGSGQLHEGAKEDFTHIQDSITDAVTALASALLPGQFVSSTDILRLSGATISADTLAVAITDGWAYYQGKVYAVTAGTINPGEGNADDNLAASYIQIVDVGSDAAYEDSTPFRVYVDKRMELVVGSGSGRIPVANILDHIVQGIRGEIRDVVLLSGMASEDVFDSGTGLGVRSWTGWAIADGRNGTPKLNGRTRIGIGEQGDLDSGDDPLTFVPGQKFGKNRVLLTHQESGVPDHLHTGSADQYAYPGGGLTNGAGAGSGTIEYNNLDSGGVKGGARDAASSHLNIQPSYACIPMIKL